MKNLKLAAKISLGFGLLIALAMTLGGLAVYNMSHVETDATRLAKEYVPEVAVANEVERASLLTMYEIRGYGLTGEEAYLKGGQAHLADVHKQLNAATAHATKYPALAKLKENAAKAQAKVKEYEQLVGQTVSLEHAMEKLRDTMGKAADRFIKNANEFAEDQQKKLSEEAKSGAAPEKIIERGHKIALANDIELILK